MCAVESKAVPVFSRMGLFQSVSSDGFGQNTTVTLSSGPWSVTNQFPSGALQKTPTKYSPFQQV